MVSSGKQIHWEPFSVLHSNISKPPITPVTLAIHIHGGTKSVCWLVTRQKEKKANWVSPRKTISSGECYFSYFHSKNLEISKNARFPALHCTKIVKRNTAAPYRTAPAASFEEKMAKKRMNSCKPVGLPASMEPPRVGRHAASSKQDITGWLDNRKRRNIKTRYEPKQPRRRGQERSWQALTYLCRVKEKKHVFLSVFSWVKTGKTFF